MSPINVGGRRLTEIALVFFFCWSHQTPHMYTSEKYTHHAPRLRARPGPGERPMATEARHARGQAWREQKGKGKTKGKGKMDKGKSK